MEVTRSPDLQAKVTRIASERGTDAQALALQAIERMVEYDDWLAREVEGPGRDRTRRNLEP